MKTRTYRVAKRKDEIMSNSSQTVYRYDVAYSEFNKPKKRDNTPHTPFSIGVLVFFTIIFSYYGVKFVNDFFNPSTERSEAEVAEMMKKYDENKKLHEQ